MKKTPSLFPLALAALLSAGACAAHAAPEINSKVTISENKAKNITSAGASMSAGGIGKGLVKGGEIRANGTANVNSLVVYEGNVGGDVTISKNEATSVKALGAPSNVNSVILGQPR